MNTTADCSEQPIAGSTVHSIVSWGVPPGADHQVTEDAGA